ncbi:MAG TPA: hypothetical protein VGN16_12235 [Acidobacteriaceae bacterium]|jgi:hypothetical protein
MKVLLAAASVLFCLPIAAQNGPTAPPAGVLTPAVVQQLMPPSVFFSSQTATTQIRNSAGIKFADGRIALAGLVDTGGYSTGLRERYQFYVLTDAPLEFGGKRLPPGSYGAGFVNGQMLVMDLAGTELFHVPVVHDAGLTRPRPLQIVAERAGEGYRLYLGRDYVALRRAR